MSDTNAGHGEMLAAYLDALRGAQSMRQFAIQNRFDDGWVSQWRGGHRQPQIDQMRILADNLGVPLGEILVAAGWGTPKDFGGVRPAEVPTIEAALERDTSLTEAQREAIKLILSTRRVKLPRTRK